LQIGKIIDDETQTLEKEKQQSGCKKLRSEIQVTRSRVFTFENYLDCFFDCIFHASKIGNKIHCLNEDNAVRKRQIVF
jgi:hypothetical protein